MKMHLLRCVALLSLGGAVSMASAQSASSGKRVDLRTLEHALNSDYHLRGEHVPMMGLVSAFTHLATKGGVGGMRVVTYENLPASLDRDGVGKLVRGHLSESWSLMVRETTTSTGEDEMVWVQPFGKRVRMLVVDLDGNEIDLVQMEMSPDALRKWESEHGG